MKVLLSSLAAAAVHLAFSGPAAADTLGKRGATLYLLTATNGIASLCEGEPAALSPPVALNGLATNDLLVGIDVRPTNQELYGLARNSSSGSFQLYHLTPATANATAVGTPVTLLDSGGNPIPTNASRFDIDFNPAADRLRVVASNGLNFRINVNTGALVALDGSINGLTTTVDGCAYTNNEPGAPVTTLYTIDSVTDSVYIQSSANAGTETGSVPVSLSGVPLNFTAAYGFDLAPGVNVSVANAAVISGKAYAALTVGGLTSLYRIDLTTGAATVLSSPFLSIRSLAVRPQIPYGLALDSGGTSLIRFRLDAPGTTSTLALAALSSGETLVGLDYRPSTGQLYALGINTTTHNGTLYLLDPATGGNTVVGAVGSIAFSSSSSTAIALPDPSVGYGFDFNPAADRIRVVTGDGLNFRINPNTGTPVDGDITGTGTNTDLDLNGGATTATAAAYTNSYAGATTTSLYVLDAASNRLFLQNPPNSGVLTLGKTITLNGSALDFSSACNLEIVAESGAQVNSNTVEPGTALATLSVGGFTGLYRIDLASGAATALGQIGSGSRLSGFTAAGEAGAGSLTFTWNSTPGTSYRIETSTDLTHWQPLPGMVGALQSSTNLPVPIYSGEPRRFWRAVTP